MAHLKVTDIEFYFFFNVAAVQVVTRLSRFAVTISHTIRHNRKDSAHCRGRATDTKNTRDKHPYPQLNSIMPSQNSSGRRPTP